MKKILIVLILFSIISTSNLLAQGITAKGIVAGLNLANVTGDNITNNKMKLGFALGGFITFGINHQFAIRPEIYYSAKGFGIDTEIYDFDLSLNYLDIPILGVFSINKNINLFAGPYIEIYLNGKITNVNDNVSQDIESDEINSPGFGLTVGTEYRIQQFSIGSRYNLGLSNIPDDDSDKYKHSVIQFIVGFYF